MLKQTISAAAALGAYGLLAALEPVTLKTVEGAPWSFDVIAADGKVQRLECAPPDFREVVRERYENFPAYNPSGWGGWQKGVCLNGVRAQECSVRGALDPASLRIESADEDGRIFAAGKDFNGDFEWGSFGRLPDGGIPEGAAVLISYRYALGRIDSVMLALDGKYRVRTGEPSVATPQPPLPGADEICVANIYFSGRPEKLDESMFFPVLEREYPESDLSGTAEKLLPETLRKLRSGEELHILAFGDSVTDGGFLHDAQLRWQNRFVEGLRKRFPESRIRLQTVAWGGRNTKSFLSEPSGSPYNYAEKVLAAEPDLIISEFVNDAGLPAEAWEANYNRFRKDFQERKIEWIILTPHYVRPDWMGLDRQRDIDEDPRDYVKFLRDFAAKNSIALADTSLRYGRLWRMGIPYNTLMVNCINHPNKYGMGFFVDALLALFPEK